VAGIVESVANVACFGNRFANCNFAVLADRAAWVGLTFITNQHQLYHPSFKYFSVFMTRYFPMLFVLLWSTGFIGARMGMPYAEPFSFLSLRFAIAILLLGALALIARAPWPGWRLAAHSMVVGVLLHGIYLGAVFWAIDHGLPSGISAMIVGLQPIMVAFLAWPLLNERVRPWQWVGLIIGAAGLVLVLAPKFEIDGPGINTINIAVCVFAMLGQTAGTIYQKKFATSVPLRTGTLWQYVGALIPSTLYALSFETYAFEWNGESIFAMAWLVLVLSIAAVFLLMLLIRDGSVSKVSSLFYLVPASTAIIAYFLFGETLNSVQLIGMVACAIGVRIAMTSNSAKN
jgi:drug/metabolite transporter (DMT)-like permease